MGADRTTGSGWMLATLVLLMSGLVIMTGPLWTPTAGTSSASRMPDDTNARPDLLEVSTGDGLADIVVSQAGAPRRLPGRVTYVIRVQNVGERDAEDVRGSYQCVDGRAAISVAQDGHDLTLGPLAQGQSLTYAIDCPYSFWAPTDALHVRVEATPASTQANNTLELGQLQ
jgi:hypothetical protein